MKKPKALNIKGLKPHHLNGQLVIQTGHKDEVIFQELHSKQGNKIERIVQWIANTRDEKLKEMLIDMGWTPPPAPDNKKGVQVNNKDINADVKIKIKYSCLECGLKNIELAVPARIVDEDVVTWMKYAVGANIRKDHTLRSPECPADSAQEVMIPMTGTDRIGG